MVFVFVCATEWIKWNAGVFVLWVEVYDIAYPFRWNMLHDKCCGISMRVKDCHTISSLYIREHHGLQKRAFPYSCFANDIDMLQSVFVFNAKGDVGIAPGGGANGGDGGHHSSISGVCWLHKGV